MELYTTLALMPSSCARYGHHGNGFAANRDYTPVRKPITVTQITRQVFGRCRHETCRFWLRELNLAPSAKKSSEATDIELEFFRFGCLMCVSFSGNCYMSIAGGERSVPTVVRVPKTVVYLII